MKAKEDRMTENEHKHNMNMNKKKYRLGSREIQEEYFTTNNTRDEYNRIFEFPPTNEKRNQPTDR